ncbi:MAG TPA: hypothetical protein ENF89_03140 [Candidatus Bathyarchaeota archaeon]|nr:hypothetical protein [Candidatus Bathyarchaeota archaeon]
MRIPRTLYHILRFLLDALILGGVALAASYGAIHLIDNYGGNPILIGASTLLLGILLLWLDEQLARMR